jgi:uncharacterized metal-binding protein YceD (DUF177 family)
MKIWLDQVREAPCRWDETESFAAETLDRPDVLALGPVTWRGEVVYADPGFLLRGELSYEQTLACTRCLEPHAASVSAEVELLLMVEAHAERGPRPAHAAPETHGARLGREARGSRGSLAQREREAELEVGEALEKGDLDTLVIADEILDTRAIVIEQLQLNVPMKPLCRPDCLGFCPRCGADLNAQSGECSCGAAEPDARWGALAALKGRLRPANTGSDGDPEDPDAPADSGK